MNPLRKRPPKMVVERDRLSCEDEGGVRLPVLLNAIAHNKQARCLNMIAH